MLRVRELPPTFWILWIGAFINRLGGFVMPLLALYLTSERGLSIEQVGVVMTIYGAGTVAAGSVGGWLADRAGRRRTLILSLLLGAAAMIQLSFARAPAHVAFSAFVLGMLGDMYRPAVSAAIADLVEPAWRVAAYGVLYWAVNLGFAVGSALGGALSRHGWWLLFLGDAATTIAYAGIVAMYIPETRPAHLQREPRAPLWAPLADRPFVAFVLLNSLVWMLFLQTFVTLPLDLREHGLQPKTYGALVALNGVLITLLQPGASRALSRFHRHRVLSGAAALVGLGFASTGLMHTVPGYAVSIAVWSLGEIAMAGIAPAVVADAAPPAQRGAYQGVYQMGIGASALLGPMIGSLVMGRLGAPSLWALCGVAGALAALGHLALGSLRPAARGASA